MSIFVHKYGGTSVGTTERIVKVAERAKKLFEHYPKQVVVLSAMSGETNRLLALVDTVNQDSPAHARDFVVASGEQVSCGLFAAAMTGLGVKARPLLAHQIGMRTDGKHGAAKIQSIKTEVFEDLWEQGIIPVVAGFQGQTEDNQITTLGRGGSDTTAVAIAAALGSDKCEINTDVDGVFSADPRIVKDASRIPLMDYEACLELAALGGKVLHTRCVELAAKYGIRLHVRESFKAHEELFDLERLDSEGTWIMAMDKKQQIEAPVVSAVTSTKGVAKFSVSGSGLDFKVVDSIFSLLGQKGVNLDIIVHNLVEKGEGETSTGWLGFSLAESDVAIAEEALSGFNKEHGYKMAAQNGFAKISVVGLGMRSASGVAAKTFATLSGAKIPVQMISTSEIKISCLVPISDHDKGVQALHSAYFSS